MLIFLILMLVQSADGIVRTAPAVVAPAPAADPCRFGRGRISSPNCPPGPPRVFVSDTPQPAAAAEAEEDTNPWAIVRDARFENTNTNQTSPEPSERPAGRFDWSARTQGAEGYAAAGYNADGTLRATSTPASDTTVPQAAFTDPDKWIGEQCAGQVDTAEADCRRRSGTGRRFRAAHRGQSAVMDTGHARRPVPPGLDPHPDGRVRHDHIEYIDGLHVRQRRRLAGQYGGEIARPQGDARNGLWSAVERRGHDGLDGALRAPSLIGGSTPGS